MLFTVVNVSGILIRINKNFNRMIIYVQFKHPLSMCVRNAHDAIQLPMHSLFVGVILRHAACLPHLLNVMLLNDNISGFIIEANERKSWHINIALTAT